jgi:ribonuclease G
LEKEMIINATATEVEIALMEGGRLVELHNQKTNSNFSVGDIFLGQVKRLMPGLNAAFVDIGHKKDAFLHYTDLGPKLRSVLKYSAGVTAGSIATHRLDGFKIEPEIIKTGKIDQVVEKKQPILVQILKEPISTKGPRLSCEVTIPGRYLVLTPFNEVVAVSKKINNEEERKRLQQLVESIRPRNFGVIVRTAAEGKKTADLHEELAFMMSKWEDIFQQMYKANPPAKLLSELDKTSSILRDLLSTSFNRIVVNDKELYQHIKNYLVSISPDQIKILSMHKGSRPIFETFGIDRQIKASFGKTATLNSGAYIVIESTEALHVIDVNSGHKMSNAAAEDSVLKVNLEAAEEIARQLRLRDIGGIIIIDFIDMKNPDHKKDLHLQMRAFMQKDRAQHTVLPLSKFGLMQITRQRVRPEVKINTAEVCPTCNGSGKINASVLLVEDIERDLEFILGAHAKSKLTLCVHPFVEAYLKKGFPSIQFRWLTKHLRWVSVKSQNTLALTQFKFYDEHQDEIRLN